MKKTIRERESEWKEKPDRTVGVDLGDRFSHYCVLNGDGEVMEEGRMRTSEEAFRRHWEAEPRQRIVMETGTHSPWISRLLRGFGHQVIVANARKVRAISENESKNDRQDAEMLARLGYCNPRLLKPIQHRSAERQRDLKSDSRPRHFGASADHADQFDARVGQERGRTVAARFVGELCGARVRGGAGRVGDGDPAVIAPDRRVDGRDTESRPGNRDTEGALPGDTYFTHRAGSGSGDRGGLCPVSGRGGCGGAQPFGGRFSGP